jgi:hypothetical protein
VAEPFKDTIKTLEASQAVKDQLRRAVVTPLSSGDLRQIRAWISAVIGYSEANLGRRMQPLPRTEPREDLVDLRTGAH